MAKKDFAAIKTERAGGDMAQAAAAVFGKVEQATSRKGQQGTASPAEAAERAAELKTQGRKGCKAVRINMAFTPENHEFISIMARIMGKTKTEFANIVIERYRTEHPEIYEQAKEIKRSVEQPET
jgi:hypothetical protein